MSENPNPARCSNCGTVNPPGQEFCIHCQEPLTIAADADALEGTPEAADELERIEAGDHEETPEMAVMRGIGGAPMTVPPETLDPDPNRSPRD